MSFAMLYTFSHSAIAKALVRRLFLAVSTGKSFDSGREKYEIRGKGQKFGLLECDMADVADEGFDQVRTLKNDCTIFGHTAKGIEKRNAISFLDAYKIEEELPMEGMATFWWFAMIEASL